MMDERRITRREFLGELKDFSLAIGGLSIYPELLSKREAETPRTAFYFPETGHHLESKFLDCWRTRGKKLIFGLPLTEVIWEYGIPVQYFEKARFELHPSGEVMLGLLGSQLFENRGFSPSEKLPLHRKFSRFYHKRGGLENFGYPISPPLEEEGKTVQFFQRAKMAWRPETVDPFFRQQEKLYGITLLSLSEIELANLGEMMVKAKGFPTAPVEQKALAQDNHLSGPEKKIVVSLADQELSAFEDKTPVLKAAVSTGLVIPPVLSGTPRGNFTVLGKYPELNYRGWNPVRRVSYYYPRVPFNLHFWPPGQRLYFIHGAYWHADFGRPRSQGCINLDLDFGQQLYEWAEEGTPIEIT